MPNGTYGGVRGRKMKVGGNDYIIFLLLDWMYWPVLVIIQINSIKKGSRRIGFLKKMKK